MELKWEEPPASNRGRGPTKWAVIAAALLERPDHWAKVAEAVSQSAGSAARKCLAPHGTFEVTQRSVGSGKWDVYARAVK